jgi:hypothetical protein
MNDLTEIKNSLEKSSDGLTHREKVEIVVQELKKLPQVECPLKHNFAPGVYLREIFMPAGSIVIGRIHRTEHFNVIVSGLCSIVHDDGSHEYLRGPMTFVSKAGVQKILYIHEDTIWQTIHPTDETDLERLDEMLIEPPPVLSLTVQKAQEQLEN